MTQGWDSTDRPRKARAITPGRLVRRFIAARGGATAVEFAIVAAPFLFLLAAVFETAILFFTQSAIETGLNKAARQIRTGQVQAQGLTASQFKDLVCSNLASYLDCQNNLQIDVRSFPAFSDVHVPDLVVDDELVEDFEYRPGGAMEVVVARAAYVWDLMTPDPISGLANLSGGKRLLAAGATFRNEPF